MQEDDECWSQWDIGVHFAEEGLWVSIYLLYNWCFDVSDVSITEIRDGCTERMVLNREIRD